jgi:hypothetical protein
MPESEAVRRPPVTGEDREDRHMVHVHVFNTLTDVADDHQHLVQGTTGPARDAGRSHIHRIRVRTSYFDDHWHWLDIMTGPAVDTMEGSHVHPFGGETSHDDGHSHDVFDTTAQAPDCRYDEDPDEEPLPPPVEKAKPKSGKR